MFRLNKVIKSIAFIGSVLAISFSLSYLVSAWTEPNVNPPNPVSGVFTPLNSGNTNQSKSGWLGIGGAFAPVMPLDIRGSTTESFWVRNGTTYFFAGADNANKRARIGAYEEGVGWKNLILNEGGGNVGIGTTGPSFKTTVSQDITMSGDINPGTAQLSVEGITTPGKRMILGYDTTGNGFGFIKAGNYGVTWTNLALQPSGGNVGIGTPSPGAKLDVAGNIKIADGTQGAGKVLTSDANGVGSWQTSSGGLTRRTLPAPSTNQWTNEQNVDDENTVTYAYSPSLVNSSAYIVYNIGSTKLVLLGVLGETHSHSFSGCWAGSSFTVQSSTDNTNWYTLGSLSTNSPAPGGAGDRNDYSPGTISGISYMQYIRLIASGSAGGSGSCPVNSYGDAKAYEVSMFY